MAFLFSFLKKGGNNLANGKIKGITIELDAKTTGLTNALKDVDKQSQELQKELKEVDKALKLDPTNVELMAQKQQLLAQSVTTTSERLDVLRQAQSQVEQQFQNGDIGADQYRAFQRELAMTEASLTSLSNEITSSQQTQERLIQSTREFNTLLDATGTSLEDYNDLLGARMVTAIRNGTATVDQMNRAIRQVGQHALGASADIDTMRQALRNVDNGSSLTDVRQELSAVANEANQAGDAVNGMGDNLKNVAAGLLAGGGIAAVVSQALDVSSLNTSLEISMNLNEADTATVRKSIMETTAAIGDEEAAYEGVRRQMTLNKDASAETNAEIIKGAATVAYAYKEIDFKELIQESHEIGKELGISQKEALGLVNGLLDVGFPPEQLDIISEYGSQLKMAGYNSEQIQAIFAAGVDTGTWNIDILMDGLKEGRIVAAEFGQGIDKAMQDSIKGTNISAEQLEKWGQAIASGGQGGVQAIQSMNQALSLIDNDTKRNEIGVKMYGTLWEEQGGKISQTIQGMNEHIRTAAQNTAELNSDTAALESDPAYRLSVAIGSIKETLAPVLATVGELIAKMATWATENQTLLLTIMAVAAIIALIVAGAMALAPIFLTLTSGVAGITAALALLSSPITLVVAGIAALVAALIFAYNESAVFRDGVNSVFAAIKDVVLTVMQEVSTFVGEKIAEIKKFWDENGQQILQAVENVWNVIKGIFEVVMPIIAATVKDTWENIKSVIDGAIKIITGAIKAFSGLLTGDFDAMWEGIKTMFSGALEFIWNLIQLTLIGKALKIIKKFGDDGIKFIKDMVDKAKEKFNEFKTTATNVFNQAKDAVLKPIKAIYDNVKTTFTNMLTSVTTTMNKVKTTISELWDKAKAVIKPDALLQVGKDVINGLIRGITSMGKNAVEAITGVVDGVVNKAKSLLGIKSPSRVFKQIGVWTIEGMDIGMVSKQESLNATMKDITNGLLDITDHYLSEDKKITENANKEIAKIQKKSAEDIDKIQRAAYAKKRKTNKDENIKIERIQRAAAENIAKIEKKAVSDSVKLLDSERKEKLESIKSFISDKKSLEELNIVDEAYIWARSVNQFEKGTKERIEAQKSYKTAVEAVNKEILLINQEFSNKMNSITDNLASNTQKKWDEYNAEYSKRVQDIRNSMGIFDKFVAESEMSVRDMLENVQSQVDGLREWRETLKSLGGKIGNEGLMEELEGMGVKALGELKVLNSMTQPELDKFSALYEEKFRLAREQATEELAGLKTETENSIADMESAASKELDNLQKEWKNKIRSVTKTTGQEFQTLEQVGRDAGNSLLQGLSSTSSALNDKAREIAQQMRTTIDSVLNQGGGTGSPKNPTGGATSAVGSAVGGALSNVKERLSNASDSIGKLGRSVQQQANIDVNVNAAPIYMNERLVGEATFDTIAGMEYNRTGIKAITRGVNIG